MLRKVYVLKSKYKDSDTEDIGMYGSMRSLARGFAEHILKETTLKVIFSATKAEDRAKDEQEFNVEVVHKIADLLMALFDLDPSAEECRDGETVYSWVEEEVQWVGIEADEEEADDEEEDEE